MTTVSTLNNSSLLMMSPIFTFILSRGFGDKAKRLPFSLKILLENLLRNEDGGILKSKTLSVIGLDPHANRNRSRLSTGTRSHARILLCACQLLI